MTADLRRALAALRVQPVPQNTPPGGGSRTSRWARLLELATTLVASRRLPQWPTPVGVKQLPARVRPIYGDLTDDARTRRGRRAELAGTYSNFWTNSLVVSDVGGGYYDIEWLSDDGDVLDYRASMGPKYVRSVIRRGRWKRSASSESP